MWPHGSWTRERQVNHWCQTTYPSCDWKHKGCRLKIHCYLAFSFARARCIKCHVLICISPQSDWRTEFQTSGKGNWNARSNNPCCEYFASFWKWSGQEPNTEPPCAKPGNKLLQITVSKWQHRNFCQKLFIEQRHYCFILVITRNRLSSLPIVSARETTPGHEQCESSNPEVWTPSPIKTKFFIVWNPRIYIYIAISYIVECMTLWRCVFFHEILLSLNKLIHLHVADHEANVEMQRLQKNLLVQSAFFLVHHLT